MRKRIIRLASADVTLGYWLKNQLIYLAKFYNITAITSPGNHLKKLTSDNINIIENVYIKRSFSILTDIKSIINMIYIFCKPHTSIVHSFSPKANLLSMIAAYTAGINHRIISVGGLYYEGSKPPLRILLKGMEYLSYKLSTKVIVNSFYLRDQLKTNFCMSNDKVIILGDGATNGIDVDWFKKYSDKKKLDDLKIFLPSNDCKIVLYTGRINIDKGIRTLLEMMSFLNEQKLVLVLVGPIETPGLINHIKQTHNVIHIDFTDDIRSYYNVADIYIHASIREGLSNSIMEACAMELPCVVSNIKPNMELIEHNKTGLIAKLGNAESFADQIKLLISNPEFSIQLGRAARANIVKKYEQKKVWNNLKIFYDGLA